MNLLLNIFIPGSTHSRYKMWVILCLVWQTLFCIAPVILVKEEGTLFQEVLFYGTLGLCLVFSLITVNRAQRIIAFVLSLYGIVLCFVLIAFDLANVGIMIYLLGWSMCMTTGYSKEYFSVGYFLTFMSNVLVLFALSLLWATTTEYSFLEKLCSVGSGTIMIVSNILLMYKEIGRGKNHYSERRRKYDKTALIADTMSEILSSDEEIDSLFKKVTEQCIPLLLINNCAIYLYNTEKDVLEVVASSNVKNSESIVQMNKKSVGWSSFTSGEPLLISDVELTSFTRALGSESGAKSEIAVPIIINGEVNGIIHSYHEEKGFFRDRHIQAFTIITSFCGIKLTQHKAYESIRIAERAKAEMDHYKELDKLKNRFITNISHDLKTPLSLIKAPAKQIAQKSKDPKVVSLSKYITSNADHLSRVVHQLLQLNRVDKGVNELYLETVQLKDLIKKICNQYEERSASKNIDFRVEHIDAIEMHTDAFRLEQIIHNLLGNAFRFTPCDGSIQLKVSKQGDSIRIEISDTGAGISPELHEKVFERFFKVDINNHEGTGIGLSLVKEYVSALEGEIELTSVVNEGTTFILKIPLSHSSFVPSESKEDEYRKDTARLNNTKPLMFVVEDHADLNSFICASFEEEYHCISAFDGEEALNKMKQHVPDIIVTDLMMPNRDGNSLVSEIRENDEFSHIPIIVLSAKSQTANKIDLYEIGADNFLPKPFDIEELNAVVASTLKRRKLLRDAFRTKYLSEELPYDEAGFVEEKEVSSLLEETKAIIMENLDNDEFNVQILTATLGIGRNRFQKEIKALTQLTPVEFIRSVRLNEARKKLSDKSLSVSEVAYSVGFSNLSYFTRSYKQEFGMLPSDLH